MGSSTNNLWALPDEYPEHRVYVDAFRAEQIKVSNEQMRRVMQWAYDKGRVYADSQTQ